MVMIPSKAEYLVSSGGNGCDLSPPVRASIRQALRLREKRMRQAAYCYFPVKTSRSLGSAPISVPTQKRLIKDQVPDALKMALRRQTPRDILVRHDEGFRRESRRQVGGLYHADTRIGEYHLQELGCSLRRKRPDVFGDTAEEFPESRSQQKNFIYVRMPAKEAFVSSVNNR